MSNRKDTLNLNSDYYSASIFDENLKEPFIPTKLIKQFILLLLAFVVLFFTYKYIKTNLTTIHTVIAKFMPQDKVLKEEDTAVATTGHEKIEKILKPIEKKQDKNFGLVDEYIDSINKIIRE